MDALSLLSNPALEKHYLGSNAFYYELHHSDDLLKSAQFGAVALQFMMAAQKGLKTADGATFYKTEFMEWNGMQNGGVRLYFRSQPIVEQGLEFKAKKKLR